MGPQGRLVLEDGREFYGHFFGVVSEYFGEICFNTSLTGYQEIFSDPSYTGQIVTLTVPHVGNTGINDIDFESECFRPEALIIRELSACVSSHRAQEDLDVALKKVNVGGLTGIETRALTRHIRSQGAMQALVTDSQAPTEELVNRIREAPALGEEDQVLKVTCKKPYQWTEGLEDKPFAYPSEAAQASAPLRVAVIDFGVKYNILRMLTSAGCQLTVFPANTNPQTILEGNFDGLFLSNGPGNPEKATYGIEIVQKCLGRLPIFGICLGHQILGLALGGKTFKLKFGHRGGNHPVKNLKTGCIEITSQNHGWALSPEGLPSSVEVTHLNLNDKTLEGFLDTQNQVFSVQYHPESSPGPHDSSPLFDWFVQTMQKRQKISAT